MKANNNMVQSNDRRLQVGIEKHLSGAKPVTIAGKLYKFSDIVKLLQAEIDASNAAEAARLAWIASVKESKEIQRQTAPTKRLLRGFLITTFGETSTVLADFGIQPRKTRKKLTVEEKVLVVDKLRATRAARHTMGKHQKQHVVGHLPVDAKHDAGAPGAASDAGTNGSSVKPALAVP